jgi:hypothetical protein
MKTITTIFLILSSSFFSVYAATTDDAVNSEKNKIAYYRTMEEINEGDEKPIGRDNVDPRYRKREPPIRKITKEGYQGGVTPIAHLLFGLVCLFLL